MAAICFRFERDRDKERLLQVQARIRTVVWMLFAVLAAGSMWFYVQRILIPYQREDAIAHGRPRGNLSDLYPRWLGARELLLRGRNPYSREITLEIQKGYYGRPLDATNPNDPKDEQGFVYPIYVVFLLAPTVKLPFDVVRAVFGWVLAGLTALSVVWWLRVLQWKLSIAGKVLLTVLTLGSIPVVQGIKLQQLSLLVAGILAGCAACLAAGHLLFAGILLAIATIKPQLVWPLVAWLGVWAASSWRVRWKFIAGLGVPMAFLLLGGELLLPGWWRMFLKGIHDYHKYTQNESVLERVLGPFAGSVVGWLAVAACGICIWRTRKAAFREGAFADVCGLVLALTVLIVPMYAPYNQVLLLPAILSIIHEMTFQKENSLGLRFVRMLGGMFLFWPWIAALGLTAASFWLTREMRQILWPLPFYSTFALPIFVYALSLVQVYSSASRRGPAA
jgi:hypothetical protein